MEKAALASVGGPAAVLSTIVVTFFNGLANGAAVIIAQYYGAKDRKSLHVGVHTAYLFSVVISLIVSLTGTVLTSWLLKVMNAPQDMMADSITYLRIYFMGILFTLVYNMGSAIMRAVGDSRRPLLYLLSVLLENLSGGLRGLGDVLWPTIFTFGGLFFVRLPWIIILTKIHHKVEILLISYPLAWGGNVTLSDPVLFLAEEKKNEYIWISSSKIIDYMLKYKKYVWRKEQQERTERMRCAMTDKKDCMTMEQAEQKMECLREVFSIVRLVDSEMLEKRAEHSADADAMELCQCYSFWNKAKPCENCISMESLREKKQAAKLEFLDSDIFQVFSRYVEIDGKPYVMEMLKKLDEDTLIDAVGYGKMVQKLSVYNDKLYRDALTGAYNRRYYEDEIKHVKGKAGVAILDVDDFKLYNDMHGHHAGDMALITVVEVIRQYIRKTDKLIRYGGDEFLLLLPEIDSENFARKLNKIKKKIAETSVPGYERIKLSVSIGGVSATEETVEEAVQRADKRMYLAKMYKNTAMVEGMDQKIAEEDHDEHTDILKPRILIVDDSKINRELLTEILQDKYQIIEAENGNECVEKLEKYGNDIALILLDIVMPKMDGFAVLEYMNQEQWIDDIPVIVISGEDSEEYIWRAYEAGAVDYIRRPFDMRIVYQRVFNMIKLYAKQRRLVKILTAQIEERENLSQISDKS